MFFRGKSFKQVRRHIAFSLELTILQNNSKWLLKALFHEGLGKDRTSLKKLKVMRSQKEMIAVMFAIIIRIALLLTSGIGLFILAIVDISLGFGESGARIVGMTVLGIGYIWSLIALYGQYSKLKKLF